MINKLIITEGNETPKQIQLTEYDTFPYRYKFSTPGTKKVQFALDETDEICSEAFKGCETLTKVTFPSQITKIKTEAFNGCKKLNNLIIPSTIKFVGDNAFGNCDSLTSITFEDSIPPQWVTPIENTKTFIYIPSESKFVKTEKNEEENKNTCNAFRSSLLTVEIVAKEVDKGKATHRLAEILNIDQENIGAIGDYYNDVEMLREVDIPAVTAGAPDDLKQMAKYITCPCRDGAVADFIDYLISKFNAINYKYL